MYGYIEGVHGLHKKSEIENNLEGRQVFNCYDIVTALTDVTIFMSVQRKFKRDVCGGSTGTPRYVCEEWLGVITHSVHPTMEVLWIQRPFQKQSNL